MAFDPTSATITGVAGMGLTLLGGQSSAKGYQALGQSEAKMAQYQAAVARNNAVIAGYNADLTRQEGDVAGQALTQKVISSAGATRAGFADKGIDVNSGSAAGVQEGQADLGMLDAAILRHQVLKQVWNYDVEKAGHEAQAGLFEQQAKYAIQAGKIKAKSSLLGTYASVANQASKFNTSFGNPFK